MAAMLLLGGCASQTLPRDVDQGAVAVSPGSESGTAPSATASRLWQVFERYQGVPYEYGGTSVEGFDCSGFIVTAYREGLGQPLPRTTAQMLAAGRAVDRGQLSPGDLVFFRVAGKEQHAGIYMGDNRFIHSSTSVGVTASSLTGYYWRDRYTQARRFR